MTITRTIFLIYRSVAQIYLFCDFGENVTSRFLSINDVIYECHWYSFPEEVQRILPIIMVSAQKPVYIKGFGNILCTRENFKKVNGRLFFLTGNPSAVKWHFPFFPFVNQRFILGCQWRILLFHCVTSGVIKWLFCVNKNSTPKVLV